MSKNEDLRILCENIKKLRAHYGMSKKKMAEICEISVYRRTGNEPRMVLK